VAKLSKGRKLKIKRVTAGKTLAQVAASSGVSIGMLSMLERDLRFCSKQHASKIAKAYGARIADLPMKP
jgi:transcriptional regulator with XRE-family HTH domain